MQVLSGNMTILELERLASNIFGDMLKAVVDVKKKVIAVDAELHADLEALLLNEGSRQEDLWGINLYPRLPIDQWLEFDSMINIRPSVGNRSRGVENAEIRHLIEEVVNQRVSR